MKRGHTDFGLAPRLISVLQFLRSNRFSLQRDLPGNVRVDLGAHPVSQRNPCVDTFSSLALASSCYTLY